MYTVCCFSFRHNYNCCVTADAASGSRPLGVCGVTPTGYFVGHTRLVHSLPTATSLLGYTSWVRGDSSPSGHSGYDSHISHPR